MSTFKCKMCGGDLELTAEMTVAECEYCGTKQTVPSADNDKKLTLFTRANRLRAACEFDKAAGIYESIVAEFPEEAEAYWGLVLCQYGIEYVDDPATGKKIPTCHRSSFESVMDDPNFEQAMENADEAALRVYRDEAKTIERIRKGILEVSSAEQPYDIFICYKETDSHGDRTVDSLLAQNIYDALTEKGYRVFFSRITLEDKLGLAYEPYIFAALNSAKIMLAVGTCYEHYNAVWVKNEWSRFLKMMAQSKGKYLIPCYKNIDPYDIPKEFSHLQGQDMGKIGAIQDLLRGIEKILGGGDKNSEAMKETVVVQQSANADTAPLLRRAFMCLEDSDWEKAEELLDQVLNHDPECAEAYLGLAMAEEELCTRDDFRELYIESDGLSDSQHIRRARQFAKADLNVWFNTLERERDKERRKAEERKSCLADVRKKLELVGRLIVARAHHTVGLKSDGRVVAVGDNKRGQCNVADWKDIVAVSTAAYHHTVGLKSDGRVVAVGDNGCGQCNVADWRDIVAVSTEDYHTVGLKSDGTVVAVGDNEYGQCNVADWKDIVAVSAAYHYTVGLKSDGRVVAVGDNRNGQCNVADWKDIVAVSANGYLTIGLKSDGRVVAVGYNEYGQCNVADWKDIVAVYIGSFYTVGLKSDGTVVAVGDNAYGKRDVSGWTDIVAVSTGTNHTVGLKSDGRVVAVGYNEYGQCNVADWKDIVAVSAGYYHTVGLKSDGRIVAVGVNVDGRCHVSGWKLFDNYENIDEERRLANERRRTDLLQEKERLQSELPTLKGIFSGKRRRGIEARLVEIDIRLAEIDRELNS